VSGLAATRVGDGPRPLVVLHGFLGSSRNVAGLGRGLAARDGSLSVWTLDLPGHGASPPLSPGGNLAAVAASLLDWCHGLQAPARFVGHSLGGRVALRAALLEPGAVAHIALLDTTPSPRPPGGEAAKTVEALLSAPDKADSRDTFREHFRAMGRPPEVVDWLLTNLERDGGTLRWRIDRQALAAFYPKIGAEDLWPAVEGPRRYGVHCVRGGRSGFVTEGDVRRFADAGCVVDTIDADHFLHVERPDETLARVLAGLR
jgi:esterase